MHLCRILTLTPLAHSLYSLFKRLVTQAEAFRRAVTTGEIDNTDIALVGICGDFSAAGDRTKATLAVWLETQGRQEGAEPKKLEVEASGKGKSRAVEEHEWTDKEFEKVADALSYAQIDMGSTKPGGGRTFLSLYAESCCAIAR